MAYGIGANDAANSFCTTVGSKALTLPQTVLAASIFEFLGAVLGGAGVTDTIRSKIADLNAYKYTPELLMYGMLCVLLATGIWLLVATYWELPVSTTHSVVGSIVGMSCVAAGFDSVVWSKSQTSFPYLSGISFVVLGWVFSPLIAAVFAAILFLLTRHLVLRRQNSFQKALIAFPFYAFVALWISTYAVLKKGLPKLDKNIRNNNGTCAWISAIVGAVAFVMAATVGQFWIRYRVRKDEEAIAAKEANAEKDVEAEGAKNTKTPKFLQDVRKSKVWKGITYGMEQNIHDVVETDQKIHDIHAHCENFDPKTELCYKHLQVFSACFNMFAHGSNDVANAIGPLAAIYGIWDTSSVSSKAPVPIWILVIGAVGMVAGIATLGYKIMRVLGVKMTKLSNSRGLCIELSAAIVVILASTYGLPTSTTQTITGAITAVGIIEGVKGFNWMLLVKMFGGWVATLVVTALTAAAFTAQGIFAPNREFSNQRSAFVQSFNKTNTEWAFYLGNSSNPEAAAFGANLYTNTTAKFKAPGLDWQEPAYTLDDTLNFVNSTFAAPLIYPPVL